MNLRQALALSWQSIRGHKLRSTLTTLGVVIGIGAVITFVTLGASLQVGILGDVGGTEANRIYVWAAPQDQQGGPGFGAEPVFTEHDVAALRDRPNVDAVVPYGPVRTTAWTYRNDTVSRSGGVVATSPAYLSAADLREGRLFEPGTAEVVLNPAATTAFETNASRGDTITVTLGDGRTVNVSVVGVLNESVGQSAFEGFGTTPRMYGASDGPLYSTRVTSPNTGSRQRVYPLLVVDATDPASETVPRVKESITTYLTGTSDASELVPADYGYRLQTADELLDQLRELLDLLTGFVTGIAVISLVVGAIGIANIMLVSVTERTREIGIMKAVGAQNRDVLALFLVEAVVLGVVGSVFGVALGVVGGYLGARYVDVPLVYPYEWFAIAVAVGILVGVVSGLYPAWRAARTDPIDALRYE